MDQYKKILIGTNMFCESWKFVSNKINQENIIIQDFNNSNAIYNIIFNKKINFILPLSNKDYNIIKNYNLSSYDIKILYPSKETIELLHNKNLFTKFMLKNYFQYIPEIYYLEDIKLKDIELDEKNKVIESQQEEINKLKDELTKFKQSLSMLINK